MDILVNECAIESAASFQNVPYPRERGPMGSAPYIGPRLGDGPIFEVSVMRLYSKEHPGNLSTLAS